MRGRPAVSRGRARRARTAVLLAGAVLWAARPLPAQEIIGADGLPLGELEPWGAPAEPAAAETALARRLAEIIRPQIVELDKLEARFDEHGRSGGPTALLDALAGEQRNVCRHILAILGAARKHNREISSWNLGGQAAALGLRAEEMGRELLLRIREEASGEETAAGPGTGRWTLTAAAWLPFSTAVSFHEAVERLLNDLGLAAGPHLGNEKWTWQAFLLMLRQVSIAPAGTLRPGPDLQAVLDELEPDAVRALDLGAAAAPADFQARSENLLGRERILRLLEGELAEEWDLEGGEFIYRSLRTEAEAAVAEILESASLPGALRPGLLLRGQSSGAVARAYDIRRRFFAVLGAEASRGNRAEGAEGAGPAAVYDPYLSLLAGFPPCLSPFRVEQVNDRWLRFVEEDTENPQTPGWLSRGGGVPSASAENGPAGRRAPMSLTCLLQADCWLDDDGGWQWRPRAAGSRRQLDLFLTDQGYPPEDIE